MGRTYFYDLHAQTQTRFWCNNPSPEEARLSIEQDAFACTTNPAYCSKLLKSDKAWLDAIIDELVYDWRKTEGDFDFDAVALRTYQEAARRIMALFMPAFEASGGKRGFVTIQDDPRHDQDAEHTLANIILNREIAPNYMAKIPVIEGGIEAIEYCVKYNIPICATEIFAISQALTISERYEAACKKYGNRPFMILTHISGIFDEYLGKAAKRDGIEIAPGVLSQAGVSIARKQVRVLREYGYDLPVLGGGARDLHHFTELIGGPHITINWSTAAELLDGDYPVVETVGKETDESAIRELSEKFEEFRLCYEERGLELKDYARFGPVQLFRNSFLNGWYQLLAEIAARRNALAI